MSASEILDLPVHPAAEVFPMLPDDELDELAADIKANGLQQPIVVKDGVLIDGRNRREACRRAGVEPTVKELNDVDPVAYILSANINRRHMTKGQRAMAVAVIYPDPEKGGRGKNSNLKLEFSPMHLSRARTVLRFAPQHANAVLTGGQSLDAAYKVAQDAKLYAEGEEFRFAQLRKNAPDLGDLVTEERMSLAEAEAAHRERLEKDRVHRYAVGCTFSELERTAVCFEGKLAQEYLRYLREYQAECPVKNVRQLLERWQRNLEQFLKEEW